MEEFIDKRNVVGKQMKTIEEHWQKQCISEEFMVCNIIIMKLFDL